MQTANEKELAAVQEALRDWRRTRPSRQIPAEIGRRVAALHGRYRTGELMRALGIDHRMLARWKRHYGEGLSPPSSSSLSTPPPQAFVSLPVEAPEREHAGFEALNEAVLKLTSQRGDGTALSVEGRLSLGQWRAALSLLSVSEPRT